MGKVILKNIRIYAFHGCMEEEEKIGSDYIVNLKVDAPMEMASRTDELEDAVDYVSLNAIVKEEMSVRSKLLEHVAQRIVDKIMGQFDEVESVEVSVAKQNPPIGGDMDEVCIRLKEER
ncbi:MAG: dihydroneopterin aldolase [Bacteroidetes bacterium]|nr:dihydroneopterin aldolase [Bacteroidota bacterium]MDA0935809.1 dihydroneopterin aldolase [Bacteroidota bacterium]